MFGDMPGSVVGTEDKAVSKSNMTPTFVELRVK